MSHQPKYSFKFVMGLLLVLLVLWWLGGVFHNRSFRYSRIVMGKSLLKIAAKDFAEYGYVTNFTSNHIRTRRSTNVVTIAGRQYQCYVELTDASSFGAGKLAMTTNQVFIWLDEQRPPKIIEENYQPPLFRSGY